MKALDFLKQQQQRHKNMADSMHIVYFDDELDEAIAELEEAMKTKTCEGCMHLDGVICRHDRGLYCVRQFEADYFKPKE